MHKHHIPIHKHRETHTYTQTQRDTHTHTIHTQRYTPYTHTNTERHTHTNTHKHRERHTHKHTQTQRDTHTHKHRETHTPAHTQRDTNTHTQTHTHKHRETQTHTHTERHTHTQTQRDTNTHTQRERHTHTNTERHTRRHTLGHTTTYMHTHMHRHTHTCSHTHTLSHIHTHAHTQAHTHTTQTHMHTHWSLRSLSSRDTNLLHYTRGKATGCRMRHNIHPPNLIHDCPPPVQIPGAHWRRLVHATLSQHCLKTRVEFAKGIGSKSGELVKCKFIRQKQQANKKKHFIFHAYIWHNHFPWISLQTIGFPQVVPEPSFESSLFQLIHSKHGGSFVRIVLSFGKASRYLLLNPNSCVIRSSVDGNYISILTMSLHV